MSPVQMYYMKQKAKKCVNERKRSRKQKVLGQCVKHQSNTVSAGRRVTLLCIKQTLQSLTGFYFNYFLQNVSCYKSFQPPLPLLFFLCLILWHLKLTRALLYSSQHLWGNAWLTFCNLCVIYNLYLSTSSNISIFVFNFLYYQ